uniref:Uncharacterized protein n=1 Tax=Salmo trutta TaxID=8032 RepID=A0A674CJI8_SALTR
MHGWDKALYSKCYFYPNSYIEKIEILLVFPENRPFRPQYACALSNYLLCNNSAIKELVVKLQSLVSNMSSGRKLFRLGNTVNSIDEARQTLQLSDPVLRFCLTVANLNPPFALSARICSGPEMLAWSMISTRSDGMFTLLPRLWFREPKIGCFNRKWISTSKTDPIRLFLFLNRILFCSCLLRVLKDIPRLLGVYWSNLGVVGFCGQISSLLGIMSPQFENETIT